MSRVWWMGGLAIGIALAAPVAAALQPGRYAIRLDTRDGRQLPLGVVDFQIVADAMQYEIRWDHTRTKVYFLSMRDFRCVSEDDVQCHIPYPYPHPRIVTKTDVRWLEHDLLFMSKAPAEFGAYFSNGLYYRLSPSDTGMTGLPDDIDLNLIAAPPPDAALPPFEAELRQPTVRKRWITGLSLVRMQP